MQAIHVKFLGPTNTRGSRYKATCAAGSVTVVTDHRFNPENNAARAAAALCVKLDWPPERYGNLICGGLPDGAYVFLTTKDATRYNIETGEHLSC